MQIEPCAAAGATEPALDGWCDRPLAICPVLSRLSRRKGSGTRHAAVARRYCLSTMPFGKTQICVHRKEQERDLRPVVPLPHPDFRLGTALALDPVVAVAIRFKDASQLSSCSAARIQARYVTPEFFWRSRSHPGRKETAGTVIAGTRT